MISVNVIGALILRSRSIQTSSGVLTGLTGRAADTASFLGMFLDRFRALVFTSNSLRTERRGIWTPTKRPLQIYLSILHLFQSSF